MTAIQGWRQNRERHYVTLTPPHSVVMCQRDRHLRQATNGARLALPDGVGIILAATLLGYSHHGCVSGPTLMLKLCGVGRDSGVRHFFYGGWPGVTDVLGLKLAAQLPGLVVAGDYCPPFRDLMVEEDAEIVRYIKHCRPCIVWVGLGSPKQEKWMAAHLGRINATALISVCVAFDFHSSRVKGAPKGCARWESNGHITLSRSPDKCSGETSTASSSWQAFCASVFKAPMAHRPLPHGMDAAGCSQEVDMTARDSSIGGNKPTFLRQRLRSYATESVEWRYRIGHPRKWVCAAIDQVAGAG